MPPAPDSASEPVPVCEPDCSDAAQGLLGRWLELSELERRAFVAMARELTDTSSDIERCTIDLSRQFQALADCARAQVARVEAVTAAARSINAGGEEIVLSDATAFIEEVLVKVINTVLTVSKNAMRMVYSLDDVAVEVENASKCVTQLQTINRQTRFLALNATIEAARAGAHGATFQVIAREVQDLSKQTDNTVCDFSTRIASISGSLNHSHAVLREIATVDMSEHIIAKDRLDTLLKGIVVQNSNFSAVLAETADASAALSDTIAPLIVGLQFQDRTSQHLAHVVEALGILSEAGGTLCRATHDAMPGSFTPGEVDHTLLERMVDRQTLGAVRKRFLAHLVGDTAATETAVSAGGEPGPTDGFGDIDLF